MKRKMILPMKGSYTIEIAMLFPMILTTMICIIYLSFFLHDQSVLSAAAYTSALRGSQILSEKNVLEITEESSKLLIQNKLLGTKDMKTDITIKNGKIQVSYQGVLKIPAGVLLSKFLIQNLQVDGIPVAAVGSAKCQDAVKFIRECRIVEGICR